MTKTRVRLKMCGMTREQDIAYAAELGVDAIGLIFYAKSSRCISIEQAKRILQNVPLFVDIVAVLVNPSVLLVEQILDALPVNWLQFHGEESPEFCQQFQTPYIKAIRADSGSVIYQGCKDFHQAAAILLDTPSENHYGGTGKPFNWDLIPEQLSKPFILSGGLDATNVRQAVNQCLPCAVDVCSGIEASYGIKDHKKMSQFVSALWRNHE